MTEMALAIVLMIGAALLIRTVGALATVDRGFTMSHILTARTSLTDPRFATTAAVAQLVRRACNESTNCPAWSAPAPRCRFRCSPIGSRHSSWPAVRPTGGAPDLASYRIISPEYLAALQDPAPPRSRIHGPRRWWSAGRRHHQRAHGPAALAGWRRAARTDHAISGIRACR